MPILTIERTIDLAEAQYGARFLVSRETILIYMNIIQQQAFNQDLDVFLVWDNYISVNKVLNFGAGGYVNAIAGDIGKEVVEAVSGATGTLISFNNTTLSWIVTPVSGTFLGTEAITITTGTGAGTLTSASNSLGAYSAPSDTRRIKGVTSLTDAQLLAPKPGTGLMSSLPGLGIDDYGMYGVSTTSFDNDRNAWITGRINELGKSFTFLAAPDSTANTYRLVYYKNAPEIEDEDDDDNYLIPDIFRQSLVLNGIGILAENALYGGNPQEALRPLLMGFWNSIRSNSAPTPGQNSRSESFL